MSDRAMSEAAMLASLRDIQLPVEAAGGLIADVAATIAASGVLALLIATVFRALSFKTAPVTTDPLAARRAALAGLPEDDRRLALLHLLRAHAPERYADLRKSLYQPSGGIDISVLEAEVNRLV